MSIGIMRKTSNTNFDKSLLIISLIILVFGLIMLYSASVAVAFERFGDSGFYIKKQLIALSIGIIAGYMAYKIDYHFWEKWSLAFLFISIILLILVLIPGIGVSGQGAQRWLSIGIAAFQTSELAKLSLILYLSAWISERGRSAISEFKIGFIPFATVIGIFGLLILMQPDLGSTMIVVFIGVVLYFAGGASIKHIISLAIVGGIGLWAAIAAAPYRMARLLSFLNPGMDPQGAGYHIKQALLAVGSGGFLGMGLGQSRQKFLYLPEVAGDSLFAVIAEETGFVFSVLIVLGFLFFFWRSIIISKQSQDKFGRLCAFGIGSWIILQAFVNIGAMLGVLPLTGLTLPLMSYGGSSLIVTMASIGILLNISRRV